MRIPLKWLSDYIDLPLSPVEIAKKLTSAGLEVDAIIPFSSQFSSVVVAEVIICQPHETADSLRVTTVFDGKDFFQVVCGASNCRLGIKTAFAKIDACLTDEEGKKFKIKKAKLRGVESFGMLCSFDELGLSKNEIGIVEFPKETPLGDDVAEMFGDTILEISLTPNLGHCSSLIGIARELSASTSVPYALPPIELNQQNKVLPSTNISLEVLNLEACPKYTCRIIRNVNISKSPQWLISRLELCGVRSINNVVDVTNYVMLELGIPLHAFDLDCIEGDKIVVRNAFNGEKITTLDNANLNLNEEDLLICDENKPLAIAGVMGGLNSEVTEKTKNILIEAAVFNPSKIRKTSKHLSLVTEASKRFERGVDVNSLKLALDRVASLLSQESSSLVISSILENSSTVFPKKKINCRLSRINKILGLLLSASEVESILSRLEISLQWEGRDLFSTLVPTYRNDINEEVDLIEEVARIYGYDNMANAVCLYQASSVPHNPLFLFEREIRSRLINQGLQEFLTCDLIGPSLLNVVQEVSIDESSRVVVLNPTSIEQSELRTSLLPCLLQVVKYNSDHQIQDIAGFEIGRIHFKIGDEYKEQLMGAIILSGKAFPSSWGAVDRDFDFYDLKGMAENLFNELQIEGITFKQSALSALHSGRQAAIFSGELEIGAFGEVHPAVLRRLDHPKRVFFLEINLHHLMNKLPGVSKMKPLPVYPGSERDLTLTVKEDVTLDELFKTIESVKSQVLEDVSLLAIYRSDKLGADVKNVTFRFLYRDKEKTIEQERVDAEHSKIIKSFNFRPPDLDA